jgi:hypothetical protein
MNLQNRFLSLDMVGNDVALLHRELAAIAAQYRLTIPADEIERRHFSQGTYDAVVRYQEQNERRLLALSGASGDKWPGVLGVVDTATAAAISQDYDRLPLPFVLTGLVRDGSGYPVKGARVHAFDQDMRARQPLGSPAITDSTGHFRIEYDPKAFARKEVGTADLSFEIASASDVLMAVTSVLHVTEGRFTPAGGPMVVFNAGQQAEVVVTVETAADPTDDEFSHLLRAIAFVTDIQAADLTPDDVTFLAAEFAAVDPSIDREKLTLLHDAERLSRDARQTEANVPAAAFYGLAREGLPLSLTALAVLPANELLYRLRQAISDRFVPASLGEQLDDFVRALTRVAAAALLHAKESGGQSSLADLLAAAGLDPGQQEAVLAAFVAHTGDIAEFWAGLRKHPALRDPSAVDTVQYVLQLAWLVQSDTAMLRGLRRAYPKARSIRELFQQLDPVHLRKIIAGAAVPSQTAGDDPEARANDVAREILDLLAAAYPTDAVARLLPGMPPAHFADAPTHAAVARFFERAVNTDFDLRTTRVDDLIAAHPNVIGDIQGAARTTVVNQVKRVQRLFRLSVDAASVGALLGTGLDSAHEIARVPPASFLARFGSSFETVDQAKLIYDRALTSSAASEFLYVRVFHALNGTRVMAADVAPAELHEVLLRNFPNLSELFGSLEMCACEDCRSVLSPAAYFVDLLEFLGNSTPNPLGVTPLGVLVGDAVKGVTGRRPDLPFIPLTCDNTNTKMPFVDLVNEILESYVVFGKLDAAVARDTGKATEPELSANPQYTDAKAYDTVRDAVFPLVLPYDQAVDVLRVYLDHLGSSRYDLLLALDTRDGSLAPRAAQAAEYLGVFPAEFEALTGNHFDGSSSTLIAGTPAAYGLTAKELAPALAPGAQGLAVRALQRQLNAAGAIPALTISDTFDAATQKALKAFQTGQGIPATEVPDAATWNMLGGNDPDSLEVFLSDVPEFLRRSGIAYTDLIELLKTEFINGGFSVLQFLEDHGISYADVDDLAKSGFVTPNAHILKALLDPALGMTQAQFIAWIQPRFVALGRFIVLRSLAAQCDLSATAIVRLNDKPVGDMAWRHLNRFIRLWRRMGWSIRDVDRAMGAFGSPNVDIALILALRVAKRLTTTLKLPLPPVLSFWANIETQGPDSLYERLFRSRTMQKLDDSFALNPERSELQAVGKLSDHVPALVSGLRVSEADLERLRAETGLADAPGFSAPMNLASMSLLYRTATLAAALRLSVREFLSLKRIIPFDPFLTNPFGPANTELFVDAALKVKASRFSAGMLRYLVLGEDDAPPTLEPPPESIDQVLVRLRAGLVQISAENTPSDDPHGERTRERLGMLFEPAAADQAARMIDGSVVYTAPLAGLPATFAFPAAIARRMSYDAVAGLLQLSGVMTVAEQTLLKALSAGLVLLLKTAYEKAIDALFAQPRAFVNDVLGSRGVFLTVPDAEASIFNTSVVDQFGNPTWLDAAGKIVAMDADGIPVVPASPPPVVTAVAAHFRYLLDRLLPFLRGQLARTLVEKTIADALALGPGLTQTLLEDGGVLHLNALPLHPILDDLLALEGDGLLGTYFSKPGLTGVTQTRLDPTIAFDYSSGSVVPGGAVTPFSVRWKGFLLVVTDGVHTFYLRAGGTVTLTVNGVVVIDSGGAPPDTELQETIALTAGQICTIELEFSTTTFGGLIEWRWSAPAMIKTLVPQAQLYSTGSRASMDAPRQAYRLLYKVALMLNGFGLSAGDVQYLAGHAVDFDNFDLSALPLASGPPNPALFTQWSRLYDCAALRDELPAPDGGLGLVSVLGAAAAGPSMAKLGVATVAAYLALTGVDLTDAAGALGLTDGDLRTEVGLGRVQTLLDLARLTRVTPATLEGWATTAAHLGPAEEIKRIVKARYDEATWPVVARPLNDTLRDHQRTALVAYLVARLGLENSNQLYELLLIDVDMGTCMSTSRIVQAIAAVQLFVQRCLLGLEDGVAVSAIDPRRWDWMSAYRLWEANRQVYHFPENWLEPALRDDKSPFFTELESDLLQTDLTTASAENAFLNYLYNLDEVARLDLVGMYVQDKSDGNLADDVVHLFGRTIHNPHHYYYRRRINNATWTPWERIPVDIDGVEKGDDSGVHLIPVVWNRRLYLFWPQFMERTDEGQDFTQTESAAHKDWRAHYALWEKNDALYQQWFAKWDADRRAWEKQHNVGGVSEFYPIPPPPKPPLPLEPQDDTSIQRPRKYLDISIAWSEYTGTGRWSAKQTTSRSVHCNNRDRKSYIFQGVPLNDGTLSINFLAHPISDDRWVHNPRDPKLVQEILVIDAGIDSGEFLFTGCQGDIETGFHYLAPLSGRLGIVMPDATEQDYMRFEQRPAKPGLVLNIGDYLSLNVRVLGDLLIQSRREPIAVLSKTPPISRGDTRLSRFRLLYPHQLPQFVGQTPFCYQDDLRDYFVTPERSYRLLEIDRTSLFATSRTATAHALLSGQQQATLDTRVTQLADRDPWLPSVRNLVSDRVPVQTDFLFEPLFHPYACTFVKTLRRGGIEALLSPDVQGLSDAPRLILPTNRRTVTNFERIYAPTLSVRRPYPLEDVDISLNGSYALYNWELFFYAVLLVADSLSRNQRFDEAQRWFHFIFDPMTTGEEEKPARYWNFLPFKDVERDRLADVMLSLSMPDSVLTPKQRANKYAYAQQWQLLKDNPFRPYVVARLRPLAFMKNVVMKYIDNLIRWGDQLFAQDTRESINEATQLYVLASELLGPLVQKTPQRGRVAPETYDSLKRKQIGGKLDPFSNGLVVLEQEFPFSTGLAAGASMTRSPGPVIGDTLYFCIPQNRQLLGYWDTVADRLFKIRNCLNMSGVARELPLLAPPIDPGLLVSAVAHGVDLQTVLSDLNTPAPLYRFATVYQKAADFCNDVKAFGAALLAALEKRDAEALALMRASHEANLLNLVKEVRTQQLLEAQAAKGALERTAEVITHRHEYYATLPDRIAYESTQVSELTTAQRLQNDGQVSEQMASMIASYLPDTSIGVSGGNVHFTAAFGRGNLVAQHQSAAHEKSFQAGQHTHASSLAAMLGTWMRRQTEWKFQAEQAERELAQVEQQIEASKIRIAIAQRELLNHEQQAEDAGRVGTFFRDKFTNGNLYTWMCQQVSNVYFQSYQMAFDLARKAEKAYRFELGVTTSNFIQYGYWNDLHKGLLAGERLHLALRQMERSFLDQNRRDYEITRHVSLLLHDPVALMELKQTGTCEIDLLEAFFDADYPGHYLRRIKTASVTIPAVVGPYTSVNCTLTLLTNKTRVKPIVGESYMERLDTEDDRFVSNFASIQSVATSSGQNDSGLFELNFRDERYLPFEGAGAVSRWRFDLPLDTNVFDFDTISDVVLHLRYTAREGGVMLRRAGRETLDAVMADTNILAQSRLVSLRHEFPTEWARFLSPTDATATKQELTVELPMERFPFRFRGLQLNVREVEVLMPLQDFRDANGLPVNALNEYRGKPLDVGLSFLAPNDSVVVSTVDTLASSRGVLNGTPYLQWSVAPQDVPVRMRLEVTENAVKLLNPDLQATVPPPAGRKRLKSDAIEDVIVILHFNAER